VQTSGIQPLFIAVLIGLVFVVLLLLVLTLSRRRTY
jgi:hypothetical protein